ncbi:glycosyltransferase [Pseudoflavitalea rhizosphaerae]|uniref:glycosyltransferase n=1 Tax=Pseudoflavitalea rhizosphaerae TaxID=1884793 RepID=UPI000F8D902B|nr:glycosyltransferase [Pseudoflavitalea rhizosphaerae]
MNNDIAVAEWKQPDLIATGYEGIRRLTVLHLIKSLGRGGAEMLLPESLKQHNHQEYEFHYIYFLPWKDQVVAEIRQAGGMVTCLPARNNIQILCRLFSLIRYIRKNRIQLIHCHLPWAGILGRLAGFFTGTPVVYTEHNKWERYHRITFLMNKLTFFIQRQVIAVSAEVASSIHKYYRHPRPAVQVVLNGVDAGKFVRNGITGITIREQYHIPPSATVIGIACVFRPQKQLHLWLRIAALLKNSNHDLYFIIVGDGGLRNELKALAASLQLNNRLFFAGLQQEIRPYLQAMDIFMMTSAFEGLPVALLEAMSMNCLPACTAAGGIPEIIVNGANGILVPLQQPLLLADRISELLKDPVKMQQMKKAARETVVEHFSMQQMVKELETIYSTIIRRKIV